ncbi:MAG: DEAD/DEAH box helicase family protein [Phycisphaeraceae bacterium]
MTLILKQYQRDCLGHLSTFLRRARELGKAKTAFYEHTNRLYHPAHDAKGKVIGPLEDMPYVCLRVPTGGGKTLMASYAVGTLLEDWQQREAGLVLWLAPSTKIVDQTMAALRDRKHPYREALDEKFKAVQLLDLDAALYVQRSTLEVGVTIIVTTMAALRSEETDRRRVFRDNGQLKHHFDGLTEEQREALFNEAEDGDDPTYPSLQNVIRMNKPAVIVDEAHGFRTDLSFETLRRFNPGCVLELTATPHDDSNVLHSVTAAELKADEMIKLPVLLRTRKIARDAVTQAVEKRKELERLAQDQEQAGGQYVRPVVLYQAESKGGELTPDVLKALLIKDFKVPEHEVAICVGGKDELPDVPMLAKANSVRHVITVQKLREGWDCPFAYVLCSVGSLSSERAVEQLIGRVLRMPYATRQRDEALNNAYVYAASQDFQQAAENLQDAIVHSGFTKYEAKQAVIPSEDEEMPLFELGEDVTVAVSSSPEAPALAKLPEEVREHVKIEQSASGVKLAWTGGPMSKANATAMTAIFTNEKDKQQVEVLRRKSRKLDSSPAALGTQFRVPGLAVKVDGQAELLEDQPIEADWDLSACNHELSESEFRIVRDAQQVAEIDADQRTRTGIAMRFRDDMDKLLFAFDELGPKTAVDLAVWLDRQIRDPMIIPSQKMLFLRHMVEYLIDKRGLTPQELSRHRHRLKDAAAAKIAAHRTHVEATHYQQLLNDAAVDLECFIEFPINYPANALHEGTFQWQKHFYQDVAAMNGEELMVAKYIDSCPHVDYWVRNLEKPGFFRFRMPDGYFYPDFVVELVGEYKLVIEHKGGHLEEHDKAKRELGELWEAKDTTNTVAFCWTSKDNYRDQIDAALHRLGFSG